MGIALSLRPEAVGLDCREDTYGRYSVSSIELNRRIVDPLFCIFVGVLSFGVPAYDGGPALYPGGAPDGVEGRAIVSCAARVGLLFLIQAVSVTS